MLTRKTTVDGVLKSLVTAVQQLNSVADVQRERAGKANSEAARQEELAALAAQEARRAASVASKLEALLR